MTTAKEGEQPQEHVNALFKDMEETGKWGNQISTTEKIGIGVVFCIVVIILIIVAVVAIGGNDNDDATVPSPAPTKTEFGYFSLMQEASPDVDFPSDPNDLLGSLNDPSASPQFKAAEFILFEDTAPKDDLWMQRYALNVMWYSLGGDEGNWEDDSNWPDGVDVCKFYGIECSFQFKGQIYEVQLGSNNLIGTIPYEITALSNLKFLDLRTNSIGGPFPSKALADHPSLDSAMLFENKLQGTIGDEIANSTNIGFINVHSNDLTGDVPPGICSEESFINTFIRDCDVGCDCPLKCSECF